jgi:hypothetical protein
MNECVKLKNVAAVAGWHPCDCGVINVIITGMMIIELEASYEQREKRRKRKS